MQQNQSFGGYGFQSYPKSVPPPIPLIVGEGDVTAVTFPDGSAQLYFVPAIRQTHSSCTCNVRHPYSGLGSCMASTEVWCVRSLPRSIVNILFPPGCFSSQLPNTSGECPPYSPPSYGMSNYPATPPAYREYTQKFHNDTWTSTTDIHYFYPSLRQAKHFQYCSETQTDMPLQHSWGQNGECTRPCHCRQSSSKKKIRCECHPKPQVKSSDSRMSVDNESCECEQLKKRKQVKHTCECQDIKYTSDKVVMTYEYEQAPRGGRETQTEEISRALKPSGTRKPRRKNCNTPKTNIKIRDSSESCSFCSDCSTSETER